VGDSKTYSMVAGVAVEVVCEAASAGLEAASSESLSHHDQHEYNYEDTQRTLAGGVRPNGTTVPKPGCRDPRYLDRRGRNRSCLDRRARDCSQKSRWLVSKHTSSRFVTWTLTCLCRRGWEGRYVAVVNMNDGSWQ
jgi:hypothetical protein